MRRKCACSNPKTRRNASVSDAQVVAACNASGGPGLSAHPTPAQIRRWLEWNDRNGDYDDVSDMSASEAMGVLRNVWEGELATNPKRTHRKLARNPEVETEDGWPVEQTSPVLRAAVEAWVSGKPLTAAQVKTIKKAGVNPKEKYIDAVMWAGELVPEMTRAEIRALQAHKNPHNPIMTIQGHTVSRVPKGYRVDAYRKVFTTKSACRAWLKKHVANEKRHI